MAITLPKLPPLDGYVEVEIDGERTYRNVETGLLIEEEAQLPPEPTVMDKLADAYREGVEST